MTPYEKELHKAQEEFKTVCGASFLMLSQDLGKNHAKQILHDTLDDIVEIIENMEEKE